MRTALPDQQSIEYPATMFRPLSNNHYLLLLCLCIPALLLLRTQFGDVAGHMDEYDYLFVGKTLLAGGTWPTLSYIFGWDLTWLLFAWGETFFGGLSGARAVAALFGAVSLVGMYAFVYALWRNHLTALIAALLLGFEGAHLYTSALATYDIISFTAFICALPCVLYACESDSKRLFWTILSCAALSVAVLSKYIAVIYLPLIALLVLRYSPRHAFLGMLIITTILIAYATQSFDQLRILYEVQILDTHSINATHTDILHRTFRQLIIILFLAGFGVAYALITRHIEAKKLLVLAVFSLPLFLYHLANQNVIALQKHLVFSSLFLIPIIAWWLHEFYDRGGQLQFRVAVILSCIIVYAFVNVDNLRTMRSSYPDIGNISTIASQIKSTDSVLSEDPYLFRYLLMDTVAQHQINETNWLDNDLDGKYEESDIEHAVWDKKFDYVFLNDQVHQELNATLRTMLFLRNYELVFENHYQLETMSGEMRFGTISVHRKGVVDSNVGDSPYANQSLM